MPDTDPNQLLDELVFQALGEESGLFMNRPTPGNQQIMPTVQLKSIGDRLIVKILEQFISKEEVKAALGKDESAIGSGGGVYAVRIKGRNNLRVEIRNRLGL